jgi:heme oxygenase (biliverdin-producing, ferredoxin)
MRTAHAPTRPSLLPSGGLADRLRAATRAEHRAAERSLLLRCFAHGATDRAVYRRLLSDLLPVYQRMEAAMQPGTIDPTLAAIWDPVLARSARLHRDLETLGGALAASAPALSYAAWIDELARTRPQQLVAHVYTRYLGDLSGGQILCHLLRSGLGADISVAFYQFDEEPASLKTALRARIDALAADEAQLDAWCEEARAVFRRNQAVFAALGPARLRDVARLTLSALWTA